MLRKGFVVLLMVFVLSGCAFTSLTSIKAPAFWNKKIDRVMIVVLLHDVQLKLLTERELVDAFYATSASAIASTTIMPPIKQYTNQEIESILYQYSISDVLVLSIVNVQYNETYIPQTSNTQGYGSIFNNTLYYSSSTQKTGGYVVKSPIIKLEANLYDGPTVEIAWLAGITTSASAIASYKTAAHSFASKIVYKLIEDGLVDKLSSKDLKEKKEFKGIKTTLL